MLRWIFYVGMLAHDAGYSDDGLDTIAALSSLGGRQPEYAGGPESDDVPPPELETAERARLMHHVERFNAREFDSLRDMLADDVRAGDGQQDAQGPSPRCQRVLRSLFAVLRLPFCRGSSTGVLRTPRSIRRTASIG
jgi:hypothetical protein